MIDDSEVTDLRNEEITTEQVDQSPDHHSRADKSEQQLLGLLVQLSLSDDPRLANNDTNETTKAETSASNDTSPMLLLCDLGYGVPKEARPRKEKMLAIARQLVNFLSWQHRQHARTKKRKLAQVVMVDCHDASLETALMERMMELWKSQSQSQSQSQKTANIAFPTNVSFSKQSLQDYATAAAVHQKEGHDDGDHADRDSLVYLSPDADQVLDTTRRRPPRVVVVGMLIDRRIQVDRSLQRSSNMMIPSARWPTIAGLDPKEPFNVDCILEGMQQWEWNCCDDRNGAADASSSDFAFQQAALQAYRHHQERHPQRPNHKN